MQIKNLKIIKICIITKSISISIRYFALHYIIFFLLYLFYYMFLCLTVNLILQSCDTLISFGHCKFINACKAITISLKIQNTNYK